MRICSLLPSATEIVYSLALGDCLTGATHECDYPPEATRVLRVTRTDLDSEKAASREIHNHIAASLHSGSSIYHLESARLAQAAPDLILTQELCDVCAVAYSDVRRAVRSLDAKCRVLSLEPATIDGILHTIIQVSEEAAVPKRGEAVLAGLRERIEVVSEKAKDAKSRPNVFAMEWLDPPMAGGHWVPEMIRLAGGRDILGIEGEPSFRASWEALAKADPEVVVLMPCGFSLRRTLEEFPAMHFPAEWDSLRAVRQGRVYAVDGSAYFNRPGPRIVDGLEILGEILHPTLFRKTSPPEAWRQIQTKQQSKGGS